MSQKPSNNKQTPDSSGNFFIQKTNFYIRNNITEM